MRLEEFPSLIYHMLLNERLPVIEISQVAPICALLSDSDMNDLVSGFMQESCLPYKPSRQLGSVL